MKKIFTFSAIVSLFAVLVSLAGCTTKELDVDPMGETFSFAGVAPNPVMRGGALRIFGRSLDQVSEVHFAGDVTVTEFVKLSQGAKLDTLEVIVPLEGPEVGKVTLVAKDGRVLTSQADLTFTEPIKIESFSPASVLSGEVITFKGEYLNAVKEIFFSGEDAVSVAFESQSRHELKVKLPANAVSGPVILSDVNEIEDEKSIPNHIYTETDLVVGDPVVTKAEKKATYKSGDVITVVGEHLDMIKNVALPRVAEVEFTLAEDAKSISFNLPPKASDGNITLTSYAGKNFDAGEIETVNVTELSVKSLAEDGRYKAGVEVEISGSDLDLVTKVEFTGAEASWYAQDNKIIAVQPAEAQDGAVTVTLESGKKAYSDDLEVVKPVITAIEAPETIVAGQTEVTLIGTDLDLVESVKMGNKDQSFIDCEFDFDVDEEENLIIVVEIPEQAYSGPIIVTSAAGYESSTEKLDVTYDMAVSIKFASPSFGLGQNIAFTGKNLMQIEQVFIKGKKVTSFVQRADDAMAFALPDKLGPGVYRLDLVLIDGTELTWPVPFEVTAPFTETFFWEGNEDLSGGAQPYLGADGALAGSLEVGDLIRVYFTIPGDGWWFEIFSGHWDGMLFKATSDNTDPDAGYCVFEVTEENIGNLTAVGGWGGVLVVQGSVTVTGASVIHFGAAETRKTVWTGEVDFASWSGSVQLTMDKLGELQAGNKLVVVYTAADGSDPQLKLADITWTILPGFAEIANEWGVVGLAAGSGEYVYTLTDADIAAIQNNQADWGESGMVNGLVFFGQQATVTEIAVASTGAAAPTPKIVWEGEVDFASWSGSIQLLVDQMGAFEAGSKLVFTYSAADGSDPQFKLADITWTILPGFAEIANEWGVVGVPAGEDLEFTYELTQADVDAIATNQADWGESGMVNGIVAFGQQAVVTQIAIL